MVKPQYIPNRGDLVWIDLDPTKGSEQAKTRPALALSPKTYNHKTGLAILCPITSVAKGYPFEVKLESKEVSGVILSDHVRSLDWQARNIRFIAKLDANTVQEVQTKLALLIQT